MNVKMNMKISEIDQIENVYIPASPDDSSQSMGAVLFQNYLMDKKNFHIETPYLGFDFDNIDKVTITNFFENSNYRISISKINEKAAKILSSGKIIARVSGKAEFGARALGNRSILAHPSSQGVVKKINKTIKNRDFWMPFAAIALDEHKEKYFKLNSDNKSYSFMTICLETTEAGKRSFSNAIHAYDTTCRPQILRKDQNLELHDLIKKFGDIVGTYGLLNTSLNFHGRPIINDLSDCKEILDNSELDAFIINEVLIEKK